MATRRLALHKLLKSIAAEIPGTVVYFQPPEDTKMTFPAIRYTKSVKKNTQADNRVYSQQQFYDIIVIEHDPEKPLADLVSKFPGVQCGTSYKANNLYHEPFTIYY